MKPTRQQLKSIARRGVVRAAPLAPVGGPGAVRDVVARGRTVAAADAIGTGDYATACTLIEPLTTGPKPTAAALSLLAQARAGQGELDAGLELARRAAAQPDADVTALLTHSHLAREAGEETEARSVLDRLLYLPPNTIKDVSSAIEALQHTDVAMVEQYRQALQRWGRALDEERLAEIEAMLRLKDAHQQGPEAITECLERVATDRQRPLATVTPVLLDLREFDLLAEFVADHRASGSVEPIQTRQLRRAAERALIAGHAAAAATMSAAVLAADGRDRHAGEIHTSATDQVAISEQGWHWATRAEAPSYPPNPDTVLAVLAQSLPIQSGGYATRSHGVLAGLARKGWDVAATTRLGFPYDRWSDKDTRVVPSADVVDGVTYGRMLEPGRRRYPQHPLASYIGRFSDEIVTQARQRGVSLLHASSFYVNGLATGQAARRLGLPFIYELRGLEDLMKISRDAAFDTTTRYRFLTRLETDICQQADAVFVITEALRREMAARGVPEEKMVVLPNGVHADQFVPRDRDRELEKQLGVRNKTVIGYAGGLVDYEGVDLLLDAVAKLTATRRDFHVLIVGDGHYERRLRKRADALRLGDVVTFTGRVPHEDVPQYLSLFDITPFPRLPLPVCELISPIKPFEAMAMAKAAVVSSVDALTEIVQHEQTGLVFTKGDAEDLAASLTRLLDEPDLRRSLGTAARSWVLAERDWDDIVEIADETYRRVLSHYLGL